MLRPCTNSAAFGLRKRLQDQMRNVAVAAIKRWSLLFDPPYVLLKMVPLGLKIGLSDIVLDGTQLPHGKGHSSAAPTFRPSLFCDQTASWISISFGMEVGLGAGDTVLWGPSSHTETGTAAPTFRPMSTVVKRSPISATAELLFFMPLTMVYSDVTL